MSFGSVVVPSRFWDKVIPEPNSGCWLFIGRHDTKGYGAFDVGRGSVRAHRYTYEHLVGSIPDGLELDHKCRTRCCVNPAHLDPVTHLENMRRGSWATKKTCAKGHSFTEENTYWRTTNDGLKRRHCRACRQQQSQARTPEYRHVEYERRKLRAA